MNSLLKKRMKLTLVLSLLYGIISVPAFAAPIYTGVQIDDTSTGILLGYRIDRTYSVEVYYSESESNITHAGVIVDTKTDSTGVVGIARFRKKLRNVLPYYLFAKAGYEYVSTTEDYSIPSSVTLTLPYSDTKDSSENRVVLGGGAEYDFSKNLTGRFGLDFHGTDRTIYLSGIYKF